MLDVGGESTRPGAEPVAADEELAPGRARHRRPGRARRPCPSVSTPPRPALPRAALEAGATIVNDVSAGRLDPEILGVTAAAGAGFVAMHMQGEPRTMQLDPALRRRRRRSGRLSRRAARSRACRRHRATASLAADPGIGFGKTVEHNLAAPRRARRLAARVSAPRCSWAPRARPSSAAPARAAEPRADLASTSARRARSPRWCGRSTTARRSSGSTTSRPPRRDPAPRTRCGRRREARREGPLGAGPRASLLHLGHHRTARGLGAPRWLRPQPPQGAPAGGAALARRSRVHARAVAARLTSQPSCVRGGGASRTSTSRSAATTSFPERLRDVYATLAPMARRSVGAAC